MIQRFLDKIFGNYNTKELNRLQKFIPQINAKDEELKKLSDEELQAEFVKWREFLTANPDKVDEKIVDVFAGVKNAARRLVGKSFDVRGKEEEWKMVHYDVQLIGGLVLHFGKIAEMKTGEGKTLVCTLPVILNALTGKGVHVVTVNDYLAQRDAEWMKPLYEFMKQEIISRGIIFADETPVKMLNPGTGKTKKTFIWVYAGGGKGPPYRIFDFTLHRNHTYPVKMLKDFKGYLHADAFGGYNPLYEDGSIIECACWMHVRSNGKLGLMGS